MKKLLNTIVKNFSISLCITAIVIPQALQQYTKTIVNGQEKWTLNKQYLSAFDEEEPQQQKIDPQNLFHQKLNFSPNNLFDDRWSLQQPYPTDAYLIATKADNDFIISAGFSGPLSSLYSDLIISTDRGDNWELQKFGTDSILFTIDKYGDLLWLGGFEFTTNNGFILKSTDMGNNWDESLSVDSFAVMYVNFFDEINGIVVSEKGATSLKIFHTTDGGNNWTSKSNVLNDRIETYHFASNNQGWLGTSDDSNLNTFGKIMRTTDGGMNWETQFIDSLQEIIMINFSNTNKGWAAGVWKDHPNFNAELRIFSTTNGGDDWIQQFAVQDDFYAIYGCDMYSLDSLNCWLAVSNWPYLEIFRTTDGGNDWTEISQLQYVDFQLGEIEFVSETEGWITSALGMVHHTYDGGYSWNPKHKSVTKMNLYSLDFINENMGWAASRGGAGNEDVIIKTNNGGVDWDIVYSNSTASYVDMDFVSEQTGFIVSNNYSPSNYTINKTQDGGLNWNSTQFGSAELNSILFTDINNGWSVGDNNSDLFITHTSNSGDSWQQQSNINLIGGSLNNIDFSNSLNGFAVGDDGALIKTTDGGNSWETAWGNLDPNLFWMDYDLTGVFVPDPSTCWISGYRYQSGDYTILIAHTTDGGANWDTHSFSSTFTSGDIFFINESDGYSVGIFYDYKTTDGGATWSQIDYPSSNSMFFLNEGLGWAVGSGGRIFRYYDPNVSAIEEEKDLQSPDNYVLMQNYPNPFNPSTIISWQSPVGSWQTLKIYDVLGNEIATLADEFKPAGTYEVEWNAIGLPSGIYFYQLQTEGYVETKKMILLK